MVQQSFNLFPQMTVVANITLAPRKVKGIPKEEAERRAHELLGRGGNTGEGRAIQRGYPAGSSSGWQLLERWQSIHR